MFSLLTSLIPGGFPAKLAIGAAVLVAVYLGGVWTGHEATHNAWMAERAETLQAQATERAAAEQKLAKVSADYETARAATNVQIKTVTRLVQKRVVEYRDRACLDPVGLCLANAALTGSAADACQPPPAVPAAKPAR